MSECTNLDIKDATGLHIVHKLQHPTSRPTANSTQTTIVNATKKNFSLCPAGKYSKLTKWSTQWCHQAIEGQSSLEAETVQPLGTLRNMWSKQKLAAETLRETHFLSNKETEKWNADYVKRETTGARERVEDAKAAMRQEQEDTEVAENAALMTAEPEITFH